jgi:hypothetical protein
MARTGASGAATLTQGGARSRCARSRQDVVLTAGASVVTPLAFPARVHRLRGDGSRHRGDLGNGDILGDRGGGRHGALRNRPRPGAEFMGRTARARRSRLLGGDAACGDGARVGISQPGRSASSRMRRPILAKPSFRVPFREPRKRGWASGGSFFEAPQAGWTGRGACAIWRANRQGGRAMAKLQSRFPRSIPSGRGSPRRRRRRRRR